MKGIEEAARAIVIERGLNPDCLYENGEYEDWPTDAEAKYEDFQTGTPRIRRMHKGWRKKVAAADAAIRAYLSAQDPQATVAQLMKEME